MLKRVRKPLALLTSTAVLATVGVFAAQAGTPPQQPEPNRAKNVIMMIPDGMSLPATTIARYMLPDNEKGTTKLNMDPYYTGRIKTTWANGPITDSAPAGTAYAVGHKSLNGALGVDANLVPKASVLEAAQLLGKATGLISTSEFMHATPAAFSAHDIARGNYDSIAMQMLNQNIDIYLGSGSGKIPNMDFKGIVESKGYTVVTDVTYMKDTTATKLWGDFKDFKGSSSNLSYDMDRDPSKEPSLAEMTQKAIDVLSKDEDGFFLMVEGSKIDWAAHANDTIGILSDTLAFDKAFKVAIDFAKQDGNTVVISATDHGNSGISLGHWDLTGYDTAPFSILAPLKKASKTAEGAMALLKSDKSNVDEVLSAYGLEPNGYLPADPASKDRTIFNNSKVNALIHTFKTNPTSSNLIKIMNQLAFVGYSTGGHSGEDVAIYVYAPSHISKKPLKGLNHNTEVAKFMASVMGVNLDDATSKLFVDVTEYEGASINGKTLTISKGGKTLVVNANESQAKLNDEEVSLNGQVAVRINNRFYIPQAALDLFNP